ncbi:voltage-gated sodium channel [Saccharopolyspora erythraea NRRL 2338]|uniref:Ion transport domain-containing protein n=1 Tax=Saccharopolyspora erythraea TaxID=1836 RepID=A0ABP3M608_SACER|nr:ion transporter [Saccharopolyspora erythraea]EQD83536.1 ion transporter [Saccharopolyspora erythraea D]PFG96220.1 voltage-gated sodium channel [Saccharopolyspora erythraea NRRL 2338]QRK92747.1 ion transporter [Saccharopolyspora erythraea]
MTLRARLRSVFESRGFQWSIITVIVVNALALGCETSSALTASYGGLIGLVDSTALVIFVAELVAKIYAYGWRFFRDHWNNFDFVIVSLSLLPASAAFSVVRSLRILRALRLLSTVPSMRRIVAALLKALPGVFSIVGLLMLVLYVAGVMATRLFSEADGEHFGDLGTSLLTLFQIMTGDGWADTMQSVMETKPLAWVFFVGYILISSFTVLNLFIAVVVNAMESQIKEEEAEIPAPRTHGESELLAELRSLRLEVNALRESRP